MLNVPYSTKKLFLNHDDINGKRVKRYDDMEFLSVSDLRCLASRTLRVSLDMDGLKQRDSSSSDPLSPTELLSKRKYFRKIFYIYVL